MSNFQPLEVVGRDSETQIQVGGKFNLFLALKMLTLLTSGAIDLGFNNILLP